MNEDEKSSNLQWDLWIGQEVWYPQRKQEEFCTLKQKIGFMGGGVDWKIRTNTHTTKQRPGIDLFSIGIFFKQAILDMEYIQLHVQQSFSVLCSIRAEDSFRLDFLNRIPVIWKMKIKPRMIPTTDFHPIQLCIPPNISQWPDLVSINLQNSIQASTLAKGHWKLVPLMKGNSIHFCNQPTWWPGTQNSAIYRKTRALLPLFCPGQRLWTWMEMWDWAGRSNNSRNLADWTGRKVCWHLHSTLERFSFPTFSVCPHLKD